MLLHKFNFICQNAKQPQMFLDISVRTTIRFLAEAMATSISIHNAALRGDVAGVRAVLSTGVDVNIRGDVCAFVGREEWVREGVVLFE